MTPWWISGIAFLAAWLVYLLVVWPRKRPEPKKCWWHGCDGNQISEAHHFCSKHYTGNFPHVAPPMLHLLDKLTERPICGASLREAWTIEHEKATCPECRKEADMAMLQWHVNNR